MTHKQTPSITAWYDSGCPLCRREIAALRKLDKAGNIAFVDLMNAGSCPLDRQELLARFHVRENGPILSGAAALAALWRQIPILRPLGLAARNRIVLSALEWAYLGFLKIRPRLQSLARHADRGRR
ncbi:DUF393 domain-containing protein [Aliihoeflea sp. 40Bstr573]|uniref:thiol-disulfide oxidoreductase DCC family protein n=1 Tax=Aliihoeflea sp. 40Bstr573 TaxID=2696467 RepID=UPI002094861E|nr:DUF393 domain-containing protein [Aliihoeflea sp. 40Bstr573]MCO6386814.1 DUF393 domain-containing protein [Aliihoeflea sp. 40Bstr573]